MKPVDVRIAFVRCVCLPVLIVAVGVSAVDAMFMRPEVVPSKRLIENTEAFIKGHPNDPQAYFTLARAHYLAFANRSHFVGSWGDADNPRVADDHVMGEWSYLERRYESQRRALSQLGFASPTDVPEGRSEEYQDLVHELEQQLERDAWEPDDITVEAAMQHATQAKRAFEKAISLDQQNPVYQLGLASLLDQVVTFVNQESVDLRDGPFAGTTAQTACDAYVKTYRNSITQDRELTDLPLPGLVGIVSFEAGTAILGLAEHPDVTVDPQLLLDIRTSIKKFKSLRQRAITPVILSLHPGVTFDELVDTEATVAFDFDADGYAETRTWITPKAGLLVWDPLARAKITTGAQLFGNVTFHMLWSDGYQALAVLDDNQDGRLSGSELDGLAVWFDVDANGKSQPAEVLPVAELGIRAIAVNSTADERGTLKASATLQSGETVPTWDWLAERNPN